MAMSVCVLAAVLSIQAGDKPGEEQGEVWRNFDVPAAPALSPEEQLASFQVAEGFRVELVAAEPLVVDPVFAQFDGEGRLWVVEMRGFMPNVDGTGEDAEVGSIAVLEDVDGDGRMDKRTTFLDELVMPRALCLVDGGALVLEPPYLWFCQDADGDLKCEARNRVLDGFEAGLVNPEHAPNQLMWSLDNRLYMANHGKSYSWDGTALQDGPGVGAGQWGMAEDDWGRKYTNHNSWPLFADLVPAHYLRRNGALGKAFGGANRVCRDQDCYSSRVNLGVNRAYRSGTLRDDGYLRTWTGACGPIVYRGTRFPEPFRGSAFVCEPCGNFVHACALEDSGDEIRGSNPLGPTTARAGAEFLTSSDERFRPVNLTAGPDGALYVVDLYRGILQHRVFMTTQLRKQVLERGLDQPVGLGRIWRVVPDDGAAPGAGDPTRPEGSPATPALTDMGGDALARLLTHSDGWWRQEAQREILRRGPDDKAMVARIMVLAASHDEPKALVHLLWTLDGLGLPAADYATRLLHHPEPQLVAHALRLTEGSTDGSWVWNGWQAALKRPEIVIRRQLALSLGECARPDALSLLADLLFDGASDRVLREAVVSSVAGRESALARLLLQRGAPGGREELTTTLDLLTKCAAKRTADSGALAGGGISARDLEALPEAHRESVKRGDKTYRMLCGACHQADGAGMDSLAPPLLDSDWLLREDADLARVVIDGLTGPIQVNGTDWDLTMPPLGTLSDAEIADVLNFVRFRFDPRAELPAPIQAAAIKSLR